MARRALFVLSIAVISALAQAQGQSSAGISGDWREPSGSVIRIAPCREAICATLVKIGPGAPTPFDTSNPDPAKRTRKLCGLELGYGFHLTDPTHADGGHLYDPKTGKTYHGEMESDGDSLKLRGYVGVKAFGRTETWTRTSGLKDSCS